MALRCGSPGPRTCNVNGMELAELLDYLREQIDIHVRCGYGSESYVLEVIAEQVRDELRDTDGARPGAESLNGRRPDGRGAR